MSRSIFELGPCKITIELPDSDQVFEIPARMVELNYIQEFYDHHSLGGQIERIPTNVRLQGIFEADEAAFREGAQKPKPIMPPVDPEVALSVLERMISSSGMRLIRFKKKK
jgi:hypothetical protein